jgi:hypothetical protein
MMVVSALTLPALVQVACDLGVVGTQPTDSANTPDSAAAIADAQPSKDAGADSEPVPPSEPYPLNRDAGPASALCTQALGTFANRAIEYKNRCYWLTNTKSVYPESGATGDANPCGRGVIATQLDFDPGFPNNSPAVPLDYVGACVDGDWCWIGNSTICSSAQLPTGNGCTLSHAGYRNVPADSAPRSKMKRTFCVYAR